MLMVSCYLSDGSKWKPRATRDDFPFARNARIVGSTRMRIIHQDFPVELSHPSSRSVNIASCTLLIASFGVLIFSWMDPAYSDASTFAAWLGALAAYLKASPILGATSSARDLRKLYASKPRE